MPTGSGSSGTWEEGAAIAPAGGARAGSAVGTGFTICATCAQLQVGHSGGHFCPGAASSQVSQQSSSSPKVSATRWGSEVTSSDISSGKREMRVRTESP
jgi:hypothetical protein